MAAKKFNAEFQAGRNSNNTAYPDQWYSNYYQHLYRYASYKVADKYLLDDLVQETFLIALENLPKFEGRSSEKTWLTGILKNSIYVSYRKQKAYATVFVDTDGLLSLDDSYRETKSAKLPKPIAERWPPDDENAYKNILHNAIRHIPLLWRSLFIMKYLDKESVPSICHQLQLTSSNYWMICHRAKGSLKKYVAKQFLRNG